MISIFIRMLKHSSWNPSGITLYFCSSSWQNDYVKDRSLHQ